MGVIGSADSPSIPSEGGYSGVSAAMVWSAESIANTTDVNGSTPSDKAASNYSGNWTTLANIFGVTWGLESFSLSRYSFIGAFIDQTGVVAAAVGLAASVCGVILIFVAVAMHSLALTIVAARVAIVSIAVDAYAFTKPAGRIEGALIMNTATVGLDILSLSISLAENDKF